VPARSRRWCNHCKGVVPSQKNFIRGWTCEICAGVTQPLWVMEIARRKQGLKDPLPDAGQAIKRYRVSCPKCKMALMSPATKSTKCPGCGFMLSVTPTG
jgi:hypothetical protein